jgi:hypothetical protein
MRSMLLPTIVAVVVLTIGTVYQGIHTERWSRSSSEQLEWFAQRLDSVPAEIGPWLGEDAEVDEKQFQASNCRRAISRTYRNKEDDNATVNMFLVCGTARHVTIHTPDWCYVGAGYEMQGEPVSHTIDCGDEMTAPEFLTALFEKDTPLGRQSLRIFWTYSYDGTWQGPKLAKSAYAGRKALYKIYLITDVTERDKSADASASVDFAKDLMPRLNELLFETAGNTEAHG